METSDSSNISPNPAAFEPRQRQSADRPRGNRQRGNGHRTFYPIQHRPSSQYTGVNQNAQRFPPQQPPQNVQPFPSQERSQNYGSGYYGNSGHNQYPQSSVPQPYYPQSYQSGQYENPQPNQSSRGKRPTNAPRGAPNSQRGGRGGRYGGHFNQPRNQRFNGQKPQNTQSQNIQGSSQDVRFDRKDELKDSTQVDAKENEVRPEAVAVTRVKVKAPTRNTGRKIDDKNQRERLIDDLTKERVECQFCFDRIWSKQPTWSCDECYNVFHLKCVRGWAVNCKKESDDGTWRCMICQFIRLEEPKKYLCFCRKTENPDWNPGLTPHSCGEVCEKGSSKGNMGKGCEHPCVCICHPGPCPPCQRLVTRSCGCGKVTRQEQCSSTSALVCENTCEKMLDCGKHNCQQICHQGPCSSCEVTVDQYCHCRRTVRTVRCQEVDDSPSFSCDLPCGGKLSCGNHKCERSCHEGDCGNCSRDPAFMATCACGKHQLQELNIRKPRTSCLDPIPSCGELCEKELDCGGEKIKHKCQNVCHDGQCPPCEKKTSVSCSCRASSQTVSCKELTSEILNWRCGRRCGKKMLCGRHKCENICCNFDEHVCMKLCGKKLSCGLHNCQDPCGHLGSCRRCYNTSFQERACNCGFTVQHPPIPCGAPPPDCPRPCSLNHLCGHPPTHQCHYDNQCPPCAFLCEKVCFGGHESRRNIPCHIPGISCGKPCGKPLGCGMHTCQKVCHAGECQAVNEKCTQPCPIVSRKCGHACSASCHGNGQCPKTPCRAVVELTCECKRVKKKASCFQHDELLKQYIKRKDGSTKSFDFDEGIRFAMPVDVLECDEECERIQRNAKLAAALDVDENAPVAETSAAIQLYTESLRQFCRENEKWATQVEQTLIDLVTRMKETKAPRKVHQFQPMRYDQRKYLHELAGYYGCQTQSYDQEPLRTVSAIAKADSAFVASTPLFQVVAAERPDRQSARCPPKTYGAGSKKDSDGWREVGRVREPGQAAASMAQMVAEKVEKPAKKPAKTGPVIDYFDFSMN